MVGRWEIPELWRFRSLGTPSKFIKWGIFQLAIITHREKRRWFSENRNPTEPLVDHPVTYYLNSHILVLNSHFQLLAKKIHKEDCWLVVSHSMFHKSFGC